MIAEDGGGFFSADGVSELSDDERILDFVIVLSWNVGLICGVLPMGVSKSRSAFSGFFCNPSWLDKSSFSMN